MDHNADESFNIVNQLFEEVNFIPGSKGGGVTPQLRLGLGKASFREAINVSIKISGFLLSMALYELKSNLIIIFLNK